MMAGLAPARAAEAPHKHAMVTLAPARDADASRSHGPARTSAGRRALVPARAADAGHQPATESRQLLPAFAAGSTARQVASFAAIGVVSTAAYAAIYAGLRLAMDPAPANALALVVTAVGNTAANRRFTFIVRDRAGALRDQVGGLVAFGIALAITTAAVAVLEAAAPGASRLVELAILVAANALATVGRFLLLRRWIAGSRRATAAQRHGALS